ncbi:MAG: hypothetical protein EX272_08135 [Chromatiales bacterium]|nr:MAG: hypothetical protein EX272_08135 [Chromatiales bacterium]
MQEKLKEQVLDAFQLVLRPIVKILLRFNVGVSEFTEIVKKSYVDVASTEYGIRGRPTNISRVAVMTGLTRKEVRRLRNMIEAGDTSLSVKTTPIAEILHRWHAEEDFLDAKGRPAALPFAEGEHSFSELVKRFGGDVPPGAMRTELKRVGSVVESDDGRLNLAKRSVVPTDKTDNLVTSLIHGVYPLLCTVVENSDPNEGAREPKQLTAYSTNIRKQDLGRLRRISGDRLADFAETFDDLFMAYETLNEESDGEDGITVAVGLFYFEEHDENAHYTW